ncbi:TetR/AcrR family transcriptional regulator [Yaniella flava]|uniref:TetR/AcrR family transcriptional regulator n=2 Tax=Yaniella flava TaxID=287930 RepID=A0ABN2U9X9_9MICC
MSTSTTASSTRGHTPKGMETKQRILRTAAELFSQNGYHATGLSELGDAVNLGRGALYYHIGSKEQLLYDLSVRHVQEMVDYGESLVNTPLPVEERFRRLSRKLMRVIADNRQEWTVYFREAHALSGRRSEKVRDLRSRFASVWRTLLNEGQSTGDFYQVDSLTVQAVLGMHNYSYLWINPDGHKSPEEIADHFCDILLHGITPNS